MTRPPCPRCGLVHQTPHPWCDVMAHHRQAIAAGLILPLNGRRKVRDGRAQPRQRR